MDSIRSLIYYQKYFKEFYEAQTPKVKEKIDYMLFLVTVSERVPSKFFKHLTGTDGLYEIRIEYLSNVYRVFLLSRRRKSGSVVQRISEKKRKKPRKARLKRL